MVGINKSTISMAIIAILVNTPSCCSMPEKRQVQVTQDLQDLCDRVFHTSTVVGDKLYINGGQNRNGTVQTSFSSLQNIDLSISWKIDSAPLSTLSKPDDVTNVNEPCAWSDGTNFIQYGGWQIQKSQEAFKLWEFSPSSSSWEATSADSKVNRLASGGFTNAPMIKKSYAFGGFQDQATTSDSWYYPLGKIQGAPGRADLIEYDWETKVTRNVSYVESTDMDLTIVDNTLVYVPVGEKGILVPISGRPDLMSSGYEKMANLGDIKLYDIASSTWYRQTATGANSRRDMPDQRVEGCSAVQVAPDNSSFNIYMHGGSSDGSQGLRDVWILSLPSFKWIKVENKAEDSNNIPEGRFSHSCPIIGNRQMAIIGGATGSSAQTQCKTAPVFVFDMSNLTWKSEFNPSEAPYVLPTAITDVIGGDENGNADKDKNKPEAWTNPDTEKIFFGASTSSTTSQSTPSPSPSSSTSPTPIPPAPKSSTAPIVGGVVGGLVALSVIAIGFIFMRRRRRHHQEQVQPKPSEYVQELSSGDQLHELGGNTKDVTYSVEMP